MVLSEVVGVQNLTSKKNDSKWNILNLVSCDVAADDKTTGRLVSTEFIPEKWDGEISGVEFKGDWSVLVGKRVRILKENVNGLTQVALIMVVDKK